MTHSRKRVKAIPWFPYIRPVPLSYRDRSTMVGKGSHQKSKSGFFSAPSFEFLKTDGLAQFGRFTVTRGSIAKGQNLVDMTGGERGSRVCFGLEAKGELSQIV